MDSSLVVTVAGYQDSLSTVDYASFVVFKSVLEDVSSVVGALVTSMRLCIAFSSVFSLVSCAINSVDNLISIFVYLN